MKIGSVTIPNKTILAPLAGITNLPFRLMAKKAGCGLVYSEMISSNGLVYGAPKTLRMLDSMPEEKPLAVQIFGADPAVMAEASAVVADSGADIVDINFGCSVRKIIKTGSGVALMKAPETAEAILKAVRNAVKIPVTIKMRSGWHADGGQAMELADMAEACGVDAIAVHPRIASQGFRGRADRSLITKIKTRVSVPVIGNGDILTPEDAEDMMRQTGCDAVMIGRAAIGNPWIFYSLNAYLNGEPAQPIDYAVRIQGMQSYLRESIKYIGEVHACRMMRSRLGWFSKGLPQSSKFREAIKQITTETEALEIISRYKTVLASDQRGAMGFQEGLF